MDKSCRMPLLSSGQQAHPAAAAVMLSGTRDGQRSYSYRNAPLLPCPAWRAAKQKDLALGNPVSQLRCRASRPADPPCRAYRGVRIP